MTSIRLSTESNDPIYSVKFSGDGQLIASGGTDRSLTLWDLNNLDGDYYHEQLHRSAITSLAWSNVSDGIYTASADTRACLFDLEKAQKVKTFAKHTDCINELALSKRDTLVTCSDDGTARIWDVRSGQSDIIQTPYPLLTCCIDNRYVYVSGIDPAVHCYDQRKLSAPVWSQVAQTDPITSLSIHDDFLLVRSLTQIRYFSGRRRKPYVFDGATASNDDWLIRAQIIGPNVVSGSSDGHIYTWEFASRRLLTRKKLHSGPVYDIDAYENQLVSCSEDGSLVLQQTPAKDLALTDV